MQGLSQLEVPDPAHKQIADSKIEEAPQYIDRRGRQPYPGRRREGTLEGMTRDPIAEMGKRVSEEGAPKKVRQVVVPAHDHLHVRSPSVDYTEQMTWQLNKND